MVKVTIRNGMLAVDCPYSKTFVSFAKMRGGKWSDGSQQWLFDPRDEFAVREALSDYGTTATIHGGVTPKNREQELRRFRKDTRFLIANKRVGAFGLNLQHCNYAIYYSNDFSWETRSQSEDRIHRAGQTQNCHIIDIICSDSIDVRIQRCLARKEQLVDSFRQEINRTKDKTDWRRWIDGGQENVSEPGRIPGGEGAA